MAITLRDAVFSDLARCAEFLAELQTTIGSRGDVSLEAVFSSLLTQERGQIVIAEEDGATLGMVSASYNIALRYGGEYCALEELIVSPMARGKNLGGLLVQKMIENARARGCAEVGLYLVESTEHNRPFYEKYGFIALGTEMRQRLQS